MTVTRPAPDVALWEPVHVEQMECPWGAATLFLQVKTAMQPPVEVVPVTAKRSGV